MLRILGLSNLRYMAFTRFQANFRPVENLYVQVFRSHETNLTVRKFKRLAVQSQCEPNENILNEGSDSEIFYQSKIRPVPCESTVNFARS